MKAKIEYEDVAIRLPKTVVAYLRKMYGEPKEWTKLIVCWVEADLDSRAGMDFAEALGLAPVFKKILGSRS